MKHEIYDGNFPIRALKINRYQWISLRRRSSTDLIVVDDVKSIVAVTGNKSQGWLVDWIKELWMKQHVCKLCPHNPKLQERLLQLPSSYRTRESGIYFLKKKPILWCNLQIKLLICHSEVNLSSSQMPKCLNSINLWISMVSQSSPLLTEADV